MEFDLKKARIEILLLFALYLFILPRTYMEYDMGFWKEWALEIHRHGISNAYNSSINYFPVYLYGLYAYDLLQGTEANIIQNINNIKLLFVFFDFLPIFILCCFRQKILSFRIPYLYLLLNIAYVFNSMVWGQIDSIYTNLSFIAIITALFYPIPALMLYVLALNTKPQAIEFLPVIALALWYGIRQFKTAVLAIAAAAALQLLLLLPFLTNGGVTMLLHHATQSVDRYNILSISAFNIWYLIQPNNPYFINDKDTFIVFSYKTIGFCLFAISSLLVFLPMAKQFWRLRTEKLQIDDDTYKILFLGTGLLCLFFFYFNSQMHERYAHPIIIFFFFHAVVSGNYRLYILASIPYFLSLDKAFSFPNGYLPITHYKFIFASRIIALWYTATMIYGSFLFYQLVRTQNRSALPKS
jgi:Gpi18-like mannosyltransferase